MCITDIKIVCISKAHRDDKCKKKTGKENSNLELKIKVTERAKKRYERKLKVYESLSNKELKNTCRSMFVNKQKVNKKKEGFVNRIV